MSNEAQIKKLEAKLASMQQHRDRAHRVMMGKEPAGYDPVRDVAAHVKFLDWGIRQVKKEIAQLSQV